jgi:DNA primase
MGECQNFFSPKWKFSPGFKSNLVLYNIDNINKDKGPLYITESVGNVLRLAEFGLNNAVATFGTNFSLEHLSLITKKNINRLIYIQDIGEAGDKAALLVKNRIEKYNLDRELGKIKLKIPVLKITGNDIADISKEEFREKVLGAIR